MSFVQNKSIQIIITMFDQISRLVVDFINCTLFVLSFFIDRRKVCFFNDNFKFITLNVTDSECKMYIEEALFQSIFGLTCFSLHKHFSENLCFTKYFHYKDSHIIEVYTEHLYNNKKISTSKCCFNKKGEVGRDDDLPGLETYSNINDYEEIIKAYFKNGQICKQYSKSKFGESFQERIDGKLVKHRLDGPAYICVDETGSLQHYYFNDKLHREDGPAYICEDKSGFTEAYYINDKLHREDGPACISKLYDVQPNSKNVIGSIEKYYTNGVLSRKDFGPCIIKCLYGTNQYSYYVNGKNVSYNEYLIAFGSTRFGDFA